MEKRYINIDELSEYTGLSKNTLYGWIWQKRIPYTKFGRLVKFDKEAIERWVMKNSVKAQEV